MKFTHWLGATSAVCMIGLGMYFWLKTQPSDIESELEIVGMAFVQQDMNRIIKYLSREEIACGVDRAVLEHALEHLVRPVTKQLQLDHIQIHSTLQNVSGTARIVLVDNQDTAAQSDFEISIVPDADGNPKVIVPVLATALNLAIGLRHHQTQRGHLQGGAELSTAEVLGRYIESYKTKFPGRPLPGVYTYSQNSFYSEPTHQGGGTCMPIQELHDKMLSRIPPELMNQYEPQ